MHQLTDDNLPAVVSYQTAEQIKGIDGVFNGHDMFLIWLATTRAIAAGRSQRRSEPTNDCTIMSAQIFLADVTRDRADAE